MKIFSTVIMFGLSAFLGAEASEGKITTVNCSSDEKMELIRSTFETNEFLTGASGNYWVSATDTKHIKISRRSSHSRGFIDLELLVPSENCFLKTTGIDPLELERALGSGGKG